MVLVECMTCGKLFEPSSRGYNNCPECVEKSIKYRHERNIELIKGGDD